MNFISATFVKGEEGYTLRTSSFAIPLPEEKGRVAEANNAPSQVIMGIRPEDVRVVSEGGDIQAEVYVVEPLGREDLVTFKFDQEEIRVLVPAPFRGQVGQVMRLELNKDKIHLFDPETQRSLLRRE
ncbi:TOBE domain-containing protein [Candidatus Bipolaricaulota bacterium]|nr:TOBE domain-containing protein [Candidatus Bipolaricaulota bacterium]